MRKRAPKRALRRRGGLSTKARGNKVTNVASVSEQYSFGAPTGQTWAPNVIYADYTNSLSQHVRAQIVAQGYQEFRIKLVEYRFKPLFDTFTSVAGNQVPYLYTLVDKLRANNGVNTLDAFKAAGAIPRRMDDKVIIFKFKPAVLYDTFDAAVGASLPRSYRVSPWLSTNDNSTITNMFKPSEIDHTGLRWMLQSNSGVTYLVERTTHFEFRKPQWAADPTQSLPVINLDKGVSIVPPVEPTATAAAAAEE